MKSCRLNLYATESIILEPFQLCFPVQFPGMIFSFFPAVIYTKFPRGIFIIFHVVTFQQENEIPVNAQQDSCNNHVRIFVRATKSRTNQRMRNLIFLVLFFKDLNLCFEATFVCKTEYINSPVKLWGNLKQMFFFCSYDLLRPTLLIY